ncbi:MAG: flagellar basal body L-ring protein FlgH [Fimbriimonadaceae bacterium]
MKTRTSLIAMALGLMSWSFGAEVDQDKGGKQNAGSIYDGSFKNPYIDDVARAKGDVLLIMIDEQSVSTLSANTNTSKADSTEVSPNILTGFLTQLFGPLSNSSQSTTSGTGSTNQNSKMAAKMSAIVKEVLPNGTLIIEGRRALVTNKDTQTFVLSGVIRQRDIMPDNTIASSKIAEAEIKMEGKGQISERQRKGVLTTILDWLF